MFIAKVTFILCFLTFKALANELCDLTSFPDDFKFGTASSAYQIEGGYNEDGKGPSFFDWYLNLNTSSFLPENANVAVDSYHKYMTDIAALKEIGVNYYRFSIAWTRILPNGLGNEINQAGVDYYNNVIDNLIEAGIEPLVTIFHWDTPLPIYYLGHWTSPTIVDYYVNFADLAFSLFGDRVKLWATINEPQMFCGTFPLLFKSEDSIDLPLGIYEYLCTHHVILAHAKAYRLYQEKYKSSQNGLIGLPLAFTYYIPLTNSTEDIEAANKANIFICDWILSPLVNGDYPQLMKDVIANNSKNQNFSSSRFPEFSDSDKELIKGSYDVVMVNYYFSYLTTTATYNNTPTFSNDMQANTSIGEDWAVSNIDFPIYNPGIRLMLKYIKDNFHSPEIIITENGLSNTGGRNDTDRIDFIEETLYYLRVAMCEDGVDLKAYTYWSLLDSFEWNSAYEGKFGLVDVDFDSTDLTRTLKESAYYYRHVIETRLINATSFR